MASIISHQNYGKTRVRVVRVRRDGLRHRLQELTVQALLEGDFDESYTKGDNSKVVPTDTVKNTIYVLAKRHMDTFCIEEFALVIARHFVSEYSHVNFARVSIVEHNWQRFPNNHNHAFVRGSNEVQKTEATYNENGQFTVKSGISDLIVLKTTQSGFENFHRCPYTTLQDARDRLFCTSVSISWNFNPSQSANYDLVREQARQHVLNIFAGPPDVGSYSPSVQQTLQEIGTALLVSASSVQDVTLALPNIHNWYVDLKPFGIQENTEVLVPVSDPSGFIEATIARPRSKL